MAANTLAYGFVQLRHLGAQRITTLGAGTIWDAIQKSAEEHSRMLNEILSSFCMRTTLYTERMYTPGSGTLQPIDGMGNPKVVRESGSYDVAYPIYGGGTAFGVDRISKELMTVDEMNRQMLAALQRDADWMKRHILAAILDNSTASYTDPEKGTFTIQPLAITSDGVTYLRTGGTTATDEHYYAQANAISDTDNPFDDIYTELTEHPGNGNTIVCYVPTNLKASIEALTNFIEVTDPDILVGVASDRIQASAGALNNIRGFGDEVLGKVNKVWIVEFKALPDSYMIAHAVDAGPVLAMREYPSAALQGFYPENHSPDGNLQETRMLRFCGFGVRNRVAAVAARIGNGTYATPTGYSTPLPS